MDDIYIKLSLLNYEQTFCKAADRKPINRLYFALEDPNSKEENGQLNFFLELSYWIMALSKPDKKKDKLAVYTKTLIDWSSPEAACKKLLSDLEDYGLKPEEGISVGSIIDVYLLLSKGRVTERAFAIYSIKFSRENSFGWTFSSRPQRTPKKPPETISKRCLLAVLRGKYKKKNLILQKNLWKKNHSLNSRFYSTSTIVKIDNWKDL